MQRMTNHKIKILTLLAQGHSNELLAYDLKVSKQTIKNQVYAIMNILNARNRTHAVVIALKKGLIKYEDIKVNTRK